MTRSSSSLAKGQRKTGAERPGTPNRVALGVRAFTEIVDVAVEPNDGVGC
jgi:hypothetical protein